MLGLSLRQHSLLSCSALCPPRATNTNCLIREASSTHQVGLQALYKVLQLEGHQHPVIA